MARLTMTVEEAAVELGVRVEEVYRLIRSRRLLASRAGRRLLVNREAVMSRAIAKRERATNGR
jgi:excisionase family DNA binding protein